MLKRYVDAIEAEANIKKLFQDMPKIEFMGNRRREKNKQYLECLDVIRSLQTIDVVELKRGKWIRNDNGTYSCNLCHSWIPKEQYDYARFCLYCGADMREGEYK